MLAAEQICFLDEERRHRNRSDTPEMDGGVHMFRSVMMDAGDSMLFSRMDRIIEEANQAACDLHERDRSELIGTPCETVIAVENRPAFAAAWDQMRLAGRWHGRMRALRGHTEPFPADITVKKVSTASQSHVCVIIRDLSEPVHLKKRLEQEKANRREMYQTLRNLMKSFEKEKRGIEGGILNKIEGLLLPALEKVEMEPCADIRNSYLNILRMELVGLTKGFSRELEAPLLRLTRTEMRVCRLIQKGYTGKEIADAMNISFETIQVHRRNIRKKLGLTGRSVNLFSFLSSKPFLRSPAAV